jgi:taurine dioxygenase
VSQPGAGARGGNTQPARGDGPDGQPALRPLSPAGGVEVIGCDLRQAPQPELVSFLDRMLADHGAVLLRGQDLDEQAQTRVSGCFGPVAQRGPATQRSTISYLSTAEGVRHAAAASLGAMDLHFDGCFFERPYKATVLYCLEAEPAAGRTRLVDCARAWDELDRALASRLAGRSALHVYRRGDRTRPPSIDPDSPSAVHPLVIEHPASGRDVLYACRLMTMRIVDGEGEESEKEREGMLADLFAHIERPDRGHEHCWEPGDLLVIDNRRMAHGRTEYVPTARRVLRRQVVEGVSLARARGSL